MPQENEVPIFAKIKKVFKLGHLHRKVTVWYLDDDGCARMVETTTPDKGLTYNERAEVIEITLIKHGFDVKLKRK